MSCTSCHTRPLSTLEERLFTKLNTHLHRTAPLAERLDACALTLREEDLSDLPGYLLEEVRQATDAVERAVRGDFSGLLTQFRQLVDMPLEAFSRPHFGFSVLNTKEGPQASFLLYTLDHRTARAQEVLRSHAFVSRVAARVGFDSYPKEVLTGRVQGAHVVASAGFVRYSWFTDFLHGVHSETSATDGGVLFTNFADDLVGTDRAFVKALFPVPYEQARSRGLWTQETLRFASNVYFAVHDSLGHLLPYNLQHPVKQRVGAFLRGGFNELQADMHSLWVGVAPEMRPLMLQVFTPEELDFYPVAVVLKRLCSYLPRGFEADPVHGDLMLDNDARSALLLFQALRARGVITAAPAACEEAGFVLHTERLPRAVNELFDECLSVERQIGQGVEAYAVALAHLHQRYVEFDPAGQWTLPSAVRQRLAMSSLPSGEEELCQGK